MILAHGGGWDELLLILVAPFGLVAILLWLAHRFGSEEPGTDDNRSKPDQ